VRGGASGERGTARLTVSGLHAPTTLSQTILAVPVPISRPLALTLGALSRKTRNRAGRSPHRPVRIARSVVSACSSRASGPRRAEQYRAGTIHSAGSPIQHSGMASSASRGPPTRSSDTRWVYWSVDQPAGRERSRPGAVSTGGDGRGSGSGGSGGAGWGIGSGIGSVGSGTRMGGAPGLGTRGGGSTTACTNLPSRPRVARGHRESGRSCAFQVRP